MIAYFGGAEVNHYRDLMHERGVKRMAMNYLSHYRRVKTTDWLISEHYPDSVDVFVDSGARTYNRPGVNVPLAEIDGIARDYYRFIATNIDRIAGYLEFDAVSLDDMERGFHRAQLDPEKGIVVWHAETGIEELERLCERYPWVAVSEKTLEDENLIPVYRRLARTTKLHLIGADRSLMVPVIAWHSCHFSAWISAQQRGDTFVWAGHELRRYTADKKDFARKRHRALFESLGLSAEKILADDPTENLKLSLWSWGQHFSNLERGPVTQPVTPTLDVPFSGIAENTTQTVEGTHPEWEHDVATRTAPKPRVRRPIPGLETVSHTVYATDPETGSRKPRTELRVVASDTTFRQCDGCFLAGKCPAFEPGAECGLSTQVDVATKDQRSSLYDALIGMQAQRVFFMRAAEDADGGYADKALSLEIDRLSRLLKVKDDMEQAGFSITVKAQQRGEATTGILTRLFGRDPEQPALPSNSGQVVDAEVISDTVTG